MRIFGGGEAWVNFFVLCKRMGAEVRVFVVRVFVDEMLGMLRDSQGG